MALPIDRRWIVVGNVMLRNPKKAGANAPTTTLDELITVAKSLLADGKHIREFGGRKPRLMWLSDVEERDGIYWFLAHVGDQNAADFSYINLKTLKPRDVKKRSDEGSYYVAHVALGTAAHSKAAGHLLLAEKVPGIHLHAIKDHLTWLAQDERLRKTYVAETGRERTTGLVFDVEGYESGTIGDALRGGKLQDIEFVEHVEQHEDGLDEDTVVRDRIHETRWQVKRQVNLDEARGVFSKARDFLRNGFRRGHPKADAKMFIRIKTADGQIRRTEVDEDKENILDQAFVQHEAVKDFDPVLTQRYEGLRDDMVAKMSAIRSKVLKRDLKDA